MPALPQFYDCTKCGVCCKYAGEIVVTEEDLERLGEQGLEHLCEPRMIGECGIRMKCTPGSRCIALKGDIGKCVSCSIYEYRPEMCRDFTNTDFRCIWVRRISKEPLQ